MKILVLDSRQIRELLPMTECIELMADALSALARGEVYQPLRTIIRPPEAHGLLGLMPAYRAGEQGAFGLKAICVFPENPAKGKDAHQGAVMLFSRETGELLALMNASEITAIRTAAVSAVATRLLAREDAQQLAIIGAGVQARTHLAALAAVRTIKHARIACRNIEHAEELARELQPQFSFPIEPVQTNEEAVRDADVVVTATSSPEPILRREWLKEGAHVNAVGSSIPTTRELDTQTMADAALFVDRRESTVNEAGDFLFPQREGAIGPDHIRAEIGELLIGAAEGRRSDDELTVFKSLGLAVEDLAAAALCVERARPRGVGAEVEF